MYQQFFGFKTLPFKITPDERVFFAGAHRQEMLDALLYGIERGEGIITIIGEVGIGKTTLARVLSNRFSDCFAIISIFTPNVSSLDMLRLIAQEAGLNPPKQASKVELMQHIRAYCLQLHQQGKRFLLLIDEAQTMLVETIEELRLLSNMQVDDVKLVQVLLFGQPELDRMLNSAELRQVKDRVVFQIHIEPFSRDELADYLAFRLQQAGFQGQCFFNDAVIDAIYRKTQGYARAVNRLADQALMAAFAEQTHQVLLDHVESSNQEAIQPLVLEATNADQVQRPKRTLAAAVKWIAVIFSMLVVSLLLWNWWGEVRLTFASTPHSVESTELAKPALETVAVPVEILPKDDLLPSPDISATEEVRHPISQVDSKELTDSLQSPQQQESSLPTVKVDHVWQPLHNAQLALFSEYANQDRYTIQLMSSPWRLRDSLIREASVIIDALPKAPAFYYDYSATPERPRIASIYGVYNSRDEAKQALALLTETKKGYQPEMISFKQVVELMRASQVLQEKTP